jgi:hypothetical protein
MSRHRRARARSSTSPARFETSEADDDADSAHPP